MARWQSKAGGLDLVGGIRYRMSDTSVPILGRDRLGCAPADAQP